MNPPPNNAAPLCGTHTDAEFEQVKAELAQFRGHDVEQSDIIGQLTRQRDALKSWKQKASDELVKCGRSEGQLSAALVASQAQVARLREALEKSRHEHNQAKLDFQAMKYAPNWRELCYADMIKAGQAIDLCDRALSTTATAAQASEDRSEKILEAVLKVVCPEGHDPEEEAQLRNAIKGAL